MRREDAAFDLPITEEDTHNKLNTIAYVNLKSTNTTLIFFFKFLSTNQSAKKICNFVCAQQETTASERVYKFERATGEGFRVFLITAPQCNEGFSNVKS